MGKYELLEPIGLGGVGEIHLARAVGVEGFEKFLVVKRLLPDLSEEKDYVSQFIDEARLAAGFSHANIVSVFDFGRTDEGDYFIAMEYVEGKNLRRIATLLAERKRAFPIPVALHITAEVCRGLDYAHNRRDPSGKPMSIVHRDVSPQNVIVSYEGDVKLLDFGIATSTTRAFRTSAGVIKGKLRYMAPEQVLGAKLDGRADLFGAGVILWELLFGTRPMPDATDTELVEWVPGARFERPAAARRIPGDLESILTRALSPDPASRFGGCGEFAEQLARCNARHFPEFTRGSLARFIESELSEVIHRERTRLAGFRPDVSTERSISASVTDGSVGGASAGASHPITPPEHPATVAPGESSQTLSKEVPGLRGIVVEAKSGKRAPHDSRAGQHRALVMLGIAALLALAAWAASQFFQDPPERAPLTAIASTPTTPAPTPVVTATPQQPEPPPTAQAGPSARPTPKPVVRRTAPVAAPTPRLPVSTVATRPTPAAIATPAAVATPAPVIVRAAETGWVSVNVETGWAEVWIDGKLVKKDTPLIDHPLSPGMHEVTVVREGRRRVKKIEVKANERTKVVLSVE